MNLTVEWVFVHDFYDADPCDGPPKITVPVIRVDALRRWLEDGNAEHIGDLLAQLPEEG